MKKVNFIVILILILKATISIAENLKNLDIRYIDFENGNDNNSGISKKSPWKHHPWDKNAKGNAAKCKGIHTYIFKKGVIYRGSLFAKESGNPNNPITLTIDPSWGKGEKAYIYGSLCIKNGWKRCNRNICDNFPIAIQKNIWFIDIDSSIFPQKMWETRNNTIYELHLAREPDWKINNKDDPREEWWELSSAVYEFKIWLDNTKKFKKGDNIWPLSLVYKPKKIIKAFSTNYYCKIIDIQPRYIVVKMNTLKFKNLFHRGGRITNGFTVAKIKRIPRNQIITKIKIADIKKITNINKKYWKGGTIWCERCSMPKPIAGKIIDFDSIKGSYLVNFYNKFSLPCKYCRCYVEGLPYFLDEPAEFYCKRINKNKVRIFLWFPGNRNPNKSIIEVAYFPKLITILNKKFINISGIDFKFNNALLPSSKKVEHASVFSNVISILGNSSYVSISNIKISFATAGIVGYPICPRNRMDYIKVYDSQFKNIDGPAIALSNGRFDSKFMFLGCRLIHVDIHGNHVVNTGYRVLDKWGIGPHAIDVTGGEIVNIHHNIIDTCWGSGIYVFGGSEYSRGKVKRPFIRILIHHNKVYNTLLGLQDYGAIAVWNAGPSYVYNNVVFNPVGYKHVDYRRGKRKNWYRSSCYGVGIYLDSQYKAYVFNNEIIGKNNNVNDKIYNSAGINEAMGFMHYFFNNKISKFGVAFHKGMLQHNRCFYIGNVMVDIGNQFFLHEVPNRFIEYDTLGFYKNISNGNILWYGKIGKNKFRDIYEFRKFLKKKGAIATQIGVYKRSVSKQIVPPQVKVFIPYALSNVIGEWNFYLHPKDPSIILGENINFNAEWVHRWMFQNIPRNDLIAHNVKNESFTYGILEDWVKGALVFDGKKIYCDISDDLIKKGYNWKSITHAPYFPFEGYIEKEKRTNFDIDTAYFLIELICKSEQDIKNVDIITKLTDRKGYYLRIDKNGNLVFGLKLNNVKCHRISSSKINDGKWHHVVIEVDKIIPKGINIFIDGKLCNGVWVGNIPQKPIVNNSNFTVGKGKNGKYFKGIIDFLRIAKSKLKDAEISIDKLYKWDFEKYMKNNFGY